MKLVHYYSGILERLHSVTESCSDKVLLQLMKRPEKAYKRFQNYEWYIANRKATETWIYEQFEAKGGNPQTRYPRYFVLGENRYLASGFGEEWNKVVIELENVDEKDVSFTLDDSMKLHVSGMARVVLTKEELIRYAIEKRGSLEAFVKEKESRNEYVEAQIWNPKYWEK